MQTVAAQRESNYPAVGNLVGWAVRTKRVAKGWSARRTSEESGLSPSYISKIEAGELEVSLRVFSRVAAALQMTADEILFLVQSCANETAKS